MLHCAGMLPGGCSFPRSTVCTGDQSRHGLLGAEVRQHRAFPACPAQTRRVLPLPVLRSGETRSCELPGMAGSVHTGPAGLALTDSRAHTCLASHLMSAHADRPAWRQTRREQRGSWRSPGGRGLSRQLTQTRGRQSREPHGQFQVTAPPDTQLCSPGSAVGPRNGPGWAGLRPALNFRTGSRFPASGVPRKAF